MDQDVHLNAESIGFDEAKKEVYQVTEKLLMHL